MKDFGSSTSSWAMMLLLTLPLTTLLGVASSAPSTWIDTPQRQAFARTNIHRFLGPPAERNRGFSALLALRAGSDNAYEDDLEESDDSKKGPMQGGDDQGEEFLGSQGEDGGYETEEALSHDEAQTGDGEEEEEDADDELAEDEGYVHTDHQEEIFDDEEETTFEEQVTMDEAVEEHIVSDESTAGVSSASVQVLERATAAGTSADDENSSAFVDRMELADAYDLEDARDEGSDVVQDAEAMAAVSAATAVGAGGSDPDSQAADGDEAAKEGDDTLIITDDMKDVLLNRLKFKPSDLKVMRPDIAAMVIANRLQRPEEGMPLNWYLPNAPKPATRTPNKLVKASATAVAVVAVALVAVKGQDMGVFDLEGIQSALQKIPAVLAAIPAAIGGGSNKKGKIQPLPPAAAEESPSEQVQSTPAADVEEESEVDAHPHSLKPGATEIPAYERDLDKTALDKFLTKIENAIKAFFRIKI